MGDGPKLIQLVPTRAFEFSRHLFGGFRSRLLHEILNFEIYILVPSSL